MHLTFRNVNDAFRGLVDTFHNAELAAAWYGRSSIIQKSTSRNGDVLYTPEPVIVTYTHPQERVLFNQARDCNPFFHLYEALWMLAGRNDVAPLAYYNSNIANYSDDGKVFNGPYGYRWRHTVGRYQGESFGGYRCYEKQGVDQLRIIIDHLKAVPDSRRAVLQMWNVEDDLLKIGPQNQSKDVCCNTHVYFALRKVYDGPEDEDGNGEFNHYCLDMTVCNRSNDLILGLLGANAVHFSFLQEYMAACVGVEVGVYNQITNNCHVYLDKKWQPDEWLMDQTPSYVVWDQLEPYDEGPNLVSLVRDPTEFDHEVVEFVKHWSGAAPHVQWREPFLLDVAQPMCLAFSFHKQRLYSDALEAMDMVKSDDWHIAGVNWIMKRQRNWQLQPGTTPQLPNE